MGRKCMGINMSCLSHDHLSDNGDCAMLILRNGISRISYPS